MNVENWRDWNLNEYFDSRIKERTANIQLNEYFTPFPLIEKIVNLVQWNTDTTWFDPTCGEGFFLLYLFQYLMGHEKYSSFSEEDRRSHILGRNLFMNDISLTNVEKIKEILGENINATSDDFLTQPCKKYDIILGNPPFQSSLCSVHGLRKGGNGKLYEKIIQKSLDQVTEEGYLAFVSPNNLWSGAASKPNLYSKLTHYWVQYLCLNNVKKKYFPKVGQNLRMCYFVLKRESCRPTLIETAHSSSYILLSPTSTVNPVEDWTEENEILLRKYLGKRNGFKRTGEKNSKCIQALTENLTENLTDSPTNYIIQNPSRQKPIWIDSEKEILLGLQPFGPKYILFRMQPYEKGIYDKHSQYILHSQIYYLLSPTDSQQSFFESEIFYKLVKMTTTSQFLKNGLIEYINV